MTTNCMNHQIVYLHKQVAYPGRLTSIRGIASVVVLLHHAMLLFRVENRNDTLHLTFQFRDHALLGQQLLLTLFNGQAAVTLFFVLSGCVLSLSLQRSSISRWIVTGFYVKRAFRILPTLWFAVFISLLFLPSNSRSHVDAISTSWMQTAYLRSPSLYDVVRHLIGMESFLDQPLWSLFVELFYSAVFPFIFLLTYDKRCSIAMVWLSIGVLFLPFNVNRDLNYYLLAFVAGSAIANVASAPKTIRPAVSGILLAVATVVLLCARRILDPIGEPMPIIILFETIAAAAIIYLVIFVDGGCKWLQYGPLVRLGDISFSLYLLHFPILFVIAHSFEDMVGSKFINLHGMLTNMIVGIITFLVVIPVATLTFQWFELPAQRLGRRLASKLRGGAES